MRYSTRSCFSSLIGPSSHLLPYIFCLLWLGTLSLGFGTSALAEPEAKEVSGDSLVEAKLVLDKDPISEATTRVRLGIHFDIEPGWHIYWRNSGESGLPVKIKWKLPSGWTTGELRWPTPLKIVERGDIATFGYEGEVLLYNPLNLPKLKAEENLLKAEVSWLVCKDVCIPGKASLEKTIEYGFEKNSKEHHLFEEIDKQIPIAPREIESIQLDKGTLVKFPQLRNSANVQVFPHTSQPLGSFNFQRVKSSPELQILFPTLSSAKGTLTFDLALGGKAPRSFSINLDQKLTLHTKVGETLNLDYLVLKKADALDPEAEKVEEQKLLEVVSNFGSQKEPNSQANTLLGILPLAFIAGVILNFMPCVLPVVVLKLFSLANISQSEKSERTKLAFSYMGGVLCTFLSLAVLTILLKQAGLSLGWGFQFQSKTFVLALSILVIIFSLSLFDIFSLNFGLRTEKIDQMEESCLKSFFDGILTTVLATPCTAPFLGGAIAFSLAGSAFQTLSVFFAIGLGLATPYFACCLWPPLSKLIPAPGNWMLTFKQFLGFAMLATGIWLLFVLDRLAGSGAAIAVSICTSILFIAWLISSLIKNGKIRALFILLASFLLIYFGGQHLLGDSPEKGLIKTEDSSWSEFSEEAVKTSLEAKQPVFIDFTAAWCLTCKANKKLVLETQEAREIFQSNNVIKLVADWTNGDEKVTAALQGYGGNAVPFNVVLHPGKEPIILPSILTMSSLREAIEGS